LVSATDGKFEVATIRLLQEALLQFLPASKPGRADAEPRGIRAVFPLNRTTR
jgi:hypothetical protein